MKHLKCLFTFPGKSGQVPEKSGQVVIVETFEIYTKFTDKSVQVLEESGQVMTGKSECSHTDMPVR